MSSKKSKRKIVVDGLEYGWIYGGSGIVVWDADGKKHHGHVEAVTGCDWNAIERGQWKKTSDGMVTPYDVANWIRVHLQGKPLEQNKPRVLSGVPRPRCGWQNGHHDEIVDRLKAKHPDPVLRPLPAQGPQADIYLVMGQYYHEDAGGYFDYVVEAHLDPQAALDAVAELNAFFSDENKERRNEIGDTARRAFSDANAAFEAANAKPKKVVIDPALPYEERRAIDREYRCAFDAYCKGSVAATAGIIDSVLARFEVWNPEIRRLTDRWSWSRDFRWKERKYNVQRVPLRSPVCVPAQLVPQVYPLQTAGCEESPQSSRRRIR